MPDEVTPEEQHAFNRLVRIHGIIDRSLFKIDPPLTYQKTLRATEILAKLIKAYEWDSERIWYIGESESCSPGDLLAGAYWFCVHYHGGQSSDEYRVQCVISKVYSPGASSEDGPEKDCSEEDVYKAFESISGFKTEEE